MGPDVDFSSPLIITCTVAIFPHATANTLIATILPSVSTILPQAFRRNPEQASSQMESRLRILLSCLLGTLLLFSHSSAAACFLPNGTDRNTLPGTRPGDFLPCDATAKVSMCCAIGRQKDLDICLPGGLCKNKETGVHWRESCTDKNWKSSACIKLFVDGPGERDQAH